MRSSVVRRLAPFQRPRDVLYHYAVIGNRKAVRSQAVAARAGNSRAALLLRAGHALPASLHFAHHQRSLVGVFFRGESVLPLFWDRTEELHTAWRVQSDALSRYRIGTLDFTRRDWSSRRLVVPTR